MSQSSELMKTRDKAAGPRAIGAFYAPECVPTRTDVPSCPAHPAEQIAGIIQVINEHVKRASPDRDGCCALDLLCAKPITPTKILLTLRVHIIHVRQIVVHKCENWIHI